MNIINWATESHMIARSQAYPDLPTKIPVVNAPQTLQSCLGVSDSLVQLHEVANQAYVDSMGPFVETRLAQAGARLAALLAANWPADWK
jgi:hypothetical protein